jgi:hypothetical protein
MNSSDQFPKGFSEQLLRTLRSLVLPVEIHSNFIIDMTNFVLYVNGIQHPSEPLKMDCSAPFRASRAYEKLFASTGIHYDYRDQTIALEILTKGFYVLGFDLTHDRDADLEHIRACPVKEMCD